MEKHPMRVSQMVTTWGPGAILESRNGPRVILRDGLRLGSGVSLSDLELSSPEFSALVPVLLNMPSSETIRIFRVPAGMSWATKPFPEWKLCVTHNVLYRRQCPKCRGRGRQTQAIRFVLACPHGHLDDVQWDYLVHNGTPSHAPGYYFWESAGSGLLGIRLRCPVCKRSVSLGLAYRETWPCTGRFPEREGPDDRVQQTECGAGARILQRQASNLRVPETVSLFTIPPRFTYLHELLYRKNLISSLVPDLIFDEKSGEVKDDVLQKILKHQVEHGLMKAAEIEEILRHPRSEIARAIRDILQHHPPADLGSLLDKEFEAFLQGAWEGIPSARAPRPFSRVFLEVDPGRSRTFLGFRVVPVLRLRVITVQIGYRRIVESPATDGLPPLVDISIRDEEGNLWLPGYESFGEGLFIIRDDPEGWGPPPVGDAAEAWFRCRLAAGVYADSLFRDSRRLELHPAFVWWHTLSHLLMRALAIDSGYSAPSIRERVYLQEDRSGRVRGGILLYTASRGGDGSLGGLLALAPAFDRILEQALEMARLCSADPLCMGHHFRPGELLGAACHACCLVSETSCEHRNFWLDRRILLENMP